MRRRLFITLLGCAAAWPLAAGAQLGERMRRIGVFIPSAVDDPTALSRVTALSQGLQQLGWTDGRNVRIDFRFGAGNAEQYRKIASELIALGPDVVMAIHHASRRLGGLAADGARAATDDADSRAHQQRSVRPS